MRHPLTAIVKKKIEPVCLVPTAIRRVRDRQPFNWLVDFPRLKRLCLIYRPLCEDGTALKTY